MVSVAALALVAGTGLANAQGTNRESGGQQQMQHSQSSGGAAERGGSMSREKEKGTVGQAGAAKSGTEEKSSGAMEKSGAMKDERSGAMHKNAADEKSGAAKGEHAQGQQDKSKSMSQDTSKSSKDQKDMKAEGSKSGTSTDNAENRQGTGTSTKQNAQGQTGTSTNQNAQTGTSTNNTVGQAGAGAKLSTEQRTQITSVIREEHVKPVTNVNFSISVGTRIPHEGIELHALPSRVVTIYPEWRSYKYVLVREEIVIIDPNTYEIVAVLNA
jgi:hypothetical protein